MTIKTKEPYPELKSELASPFAAIYDTKAKKKSLINLLVQVLIKLTIINVHKN